MVVVLVEGDSDRVALETLAARRGRDLAAEGVDVVAIGGAKNIGHALRRVHTTYGDVDVRGLCDAGEEGDFRRWFGRAGLPPDAFAVCVADLEDELIRALGTDAVEQIVAAAGQLASFRILQKQPAQRDRTCTQQLRRFIGARSGHKVRYARLLAAAVDLDRVPEPLERVLADR